MEKTGHCMPNLFDATTWWPKKSCEVILGLQKTITNYLTYSLQPVMRVVKLISRASQQCWRNYERGKIHNRSQSPGPEA